MGQAKINDRVFELEDPKECEQYWTAYAQDALMGKTIKHVRYLTEDECDGLGWTKRTLVIQFSDGTLIFPSMDDEGNNAGAMFGNKGNKELTFPVL